MTRLVSSILIGHNASVTVACDGMNTAVMDDESAGDFVNLTVEPTPTPTDLTTQSKVMKLHVDLRILGHRDLSPSSGMDVEL